ncbi:MAG: Asp-tRNA(Asn)/Glu-tRNA(Gln) amidotransferase subunit GatC [Cyanobacteriota bacterium]|nr:Asp-tRNA(Asn)/Glu-tRNA(Gln) amidotransferase subunit GatC [Cyanobacteriota bacterium]
MIEREQVRHVAHLARLELTPAEESQFTEQLADILAYVEQMKELDTEGVEPTFHILDLPQPTRPDHVDPWVDSEAILANAPDRSQQFFKVPRILNSEDPA